MLITADKLQRVDIASTLRTPHRRQRRNDVRQFQEDIVLTITELLGVVLETANQRCVDISPAVVPAHLSFRVAEQSGQRSVVLNEQCPVITQNHSLFAHAANLAIHAMVEQYLLFDVLRNSDGATLNLLGEMEVVVNLHQLFSFVQDRERLGRANL